MFHILNRNMMLTKTRENTCPGPFTFCHQSSPLNTLDPTWLTSSSSKLWILSCCSHLLWFSWSLWRPRDRCGGFASCSCYAMAVVFTWVKGLWATWFCWQLEFKVHGPINFQNAWSCCAVCWSFDESGRLRWNRVFRAFCLWFLWSARQGMTPLHRSTTTWKEDWN